MSSKQRRRFGAEKKARIVRRHLADEFGVQPGQIHTWVKQVLDQAEKTFERSDGPRRKEAKPDVIIIFVDDLAWTDLGCYGSSFYETPNIDRLAGQPIPARRF